MTMLCSGCGKEFEVDPVFDSHLFCSGECEYQSKYGFIHVPKNGKAHVIECDKEFDAFVYAKTNHLISEKCMYIEDIDFITGYDFHMGIFMERYNDDDIVRKSDLNMCASIAFHCGMVGNVIIANYICFRPIPLYLANVMVDKMNSIYDSQKEKPLPEWLKFYD